MKSELVCWLTHVEKDGVNFDSDTFTVAFCADVGFAAVNKRRANLRRIKGEVAFNMSVLGLRRSPKHEGYILRYKITSFAIMHINQGKLMGKGYNSNRQMPQKVCLYKVCVDTKRRTLLTD